MQAIGLSIEGCDSDSTSTVSPDYTNSTTMPNADSTVIQTSTTQKCEPGGELPIVAYYSAFVVLFQFGWATVQISHLSMIPDITSDEAERMALTSVRYAATVMSNLLVYGMCWLLLVTGNIHTDLLDMKQLIFFAEFLPHKLVCKLLLTFLQSVTLTAM